MRRNIQWKGVYPALTTKFHSDGTLDIPTFLLNVDAQIDAGVKGIIIGGSLGENSTITHQERLDLLQACVSHYEDQIDLLVNVAEGSTRNAIDLAQAAQENGAHGIMLLPPMMYKPTDKEVVNFYSDIAKSIDIPILVYNNPVDYKIEISLDMFEKLLKFDNIQAVKESTRDISNVTRMRNRFGDDLKILCGVDTLAAEELMMGADGWVAGLVCAFPKETVAIYNLIQAGQYEEAIQIYRWFLPILELDINPQLVQNIKLAEVMTGLGTEFVRKPRQVLEGAERQRVIQILETGLANRPTLPDYKNLPKAVEYGY